MNNYTSFSNLMQRRNLNVVRMLGDVLRLGTQDAWRELVPMLMVCMTMQERAALAFTALKALDREKAKLTVEAALCTGAAQPQAPLFDFLDQAVFWVDMAEPEELEAYRVASFSAMSGSRQAAFLDHMRGRKAE